MDRAAREKQSQSQSLIAERERSGCLPLSIELFQRAALAVDLPADRLQKNDVVTVVENLPATKKSGGEPGYALEVFNAVGETIAVISAPVSAVRSLRADEILCVRALEKSPAK